MKKRRRKRSEQRSHNSYVRLPAIQLDTNVEVRQSFGVRGHVRALELRDLSRGSKRRHVAALQMRRIAPHSKGLARFGCRSGLFAQFLTLLSVGYFSLAAPEDNFLTLNTPRAFPHIASRKEWQARVHDIREQILVSCGLWPLPEKSPLNPQIFGKIQRDGYSIEKVYIESLPGFYLAGNLYRPLGKGRGPFPGVLNPHGHWPQGRLADTKDGSVVARCINFAQQGMVAFAYDMVGFNDSRFTDSPTNKPFYDIHRQFGAARTDLLWNISLMGLQTWNSIRALDFLESLPDVDPKRLACTGASGGGTQTYILGAIDGRLAAQAPVCMVSHIMQGGCSCENAPGLRIEYSNMEIAAAAAPRPQILVAATGDWTKDTLSIEGPALAHIYDLFQAPEKLRYVQFDSGHNYNKTSREAVYAWLGKWLSNNRNPEGSAGVPPAPCLNELPYKKEPDPNLRVFPDGKLPEDAVTLNEIVESLKATHRNQWRALMPATKAGLAHFKETMLPAWRHTLHVGPSLTQDGFPEDLSEQSEPPDVPRLAVTSSCGLFLPSSSQPSGMVILAYPTCPPWWSKSPDTNGAPQSTRKPTVFLGIAAKLVDAQVPFLAQSPASIRLPRNQFENFFTAYNRTEIQEQVRNLIRACAYARLLKAKRVILCGLGRAGLWALLAAPAADGVIADCSLLDVSEDETLLASDLFCPGIRNIGTFEGAAMLAAPHPLLLHNTGQHFSTESLRAAYAAIGASKKLRVESRPLTEAEVVNWLKAN